VCFYLAMILFLFLGFIDAVDERPHARKFVRITSAAVLFLLVVALVASIAFGVDWLI